MKALFTFTLISLITFTAFSQAEFELKENKIYKNGKLYSGVYKVQQDNKLASEFIIENGIENGKVTHFYTNKKVKETGFYFEGSKDGKWEKWDPKGNKIGEAFYSKGVKTGTWKVWDHKGVLRNEMNYSNGKRAGIWKMWNELGELVQEKKY